MHPCAVWTPRSADAPRHARALAGPSGPLESFRLPQAPRVFLLAVLIEIAAVTVVQHDGGEALDLEPPDGFRAEVLVGDDLGLLDELREHRPGATDAAEVRRLVLLERVLHRLPPIAFADGALQAGLEQRGRELVHAARRRRAH